MMISTTGYPDFLLVQNELGTNKSPVFYRDNGLGTQFVIIGVLPGGVALYSGNLSTAPGSFATDFPNAIATNNLPGISP